MTDTNQTENDELYEELSALEQAMVSEEKAEEGTFLTGGADREFVELEEEHEASDETILNPPLCKDGSELLEFLRGNLHKFESPYAYIGGEANSPDRSQFSTAEVRVLIARLSTYESTSLSMTHSLMAQIYGELKGVFCDICFLPKPNDYRLLRENGFPVWFGTNSKFGPGKFDILSITHAISMEQLNFVPLLHDSGIPLFKDQRMERDDVPFIIVGGMNAGTTAPLGGSWKGHGPIIDAVIYGDGEETAKLFVEMVREGRKKGLTKREILASCHGVVKGFYEPDLYEHSYDGKGKLVSVKPKREGLEFPVRRATVGNLDSVRTLENKILPFTGDGAAVDVAIAGQVGACRKGTLLATERGRIPIEDVKVGDRVVTATGLHTVTKVWSLGKRPLYRLETFWGLKLDLTEDHPVKMVEKRKACSKHRFYQKEYQEVRNLKAGDLISLKEGVSALKNQPLNFMAATREELEEKYIASTSHPRRAGSPAKRKDIRFPERLEESLAETLGYLEGGGSKHPDGVRFYFAWHERELHSRYQEFMKELFGLDSPPKVENTGGTSFSTTYCSQHLGDFFNFLGWKSHQGVSPYILEGTAATKAAYLRGIFTADGTCGGKQAIISLASVNQLLLKDVQLLLLDLGIFSAFCKGPVPKGNDQQTWSVSIRGPSSWGRFKEIIGFALKSKQAILEKYQKRNTGSFGRFQDGWCADKIKDIFPLPEEDDVFDLTVEGDHSYTANGILVHNCIGGLGNCTFSFSPTDRLSTEKGCLSFEQLAHVLDATELVQEREIVLQSEDGSRKTSHFYSQWEKPLVCTRTIDGYETTTSYEHRVRVWDRARGTLDYKRVAELRKGDLLVTTFREPPQFTGTDQLTDNQAILLGLLTGDGCVGTRKDSGQSHCCLSLGSDDLPALSTVQKLLRATLGPGEYTPCDAGAGRAFNIYLNAADKTEKLTSWGLKHDKAWQKRIPEKVWASSPDVQKAFLRGLFAADGSYHQAQVSFYTASEGLARDVQVLLGHLGFRATRRSYERNSKFQRSKTPASYFTVSLSSLFAERFSKEVDCFYKHKQNHLPMTQYRTPYSTHHWRRHGVEPVDLKTKDRLWEESSIILSPFHQLEELGSAKTYDVTVPVTHNVCVNGGLVAHQCREGNEGPYRERSLGKVLEALDNATKNQGTKEVSFFSLNFNQYTDLFPLVSESVKRGYKVGLISQRIDMLAETPEQVAVQRWLRKSNYTLGVEGISQRLRNFLNKNTTEEQILAVSKSMMENGAGELKFFYIASGLEDEADAEEFCSFMEKVEAIKKEGEHTTRFRISFTPLFPSAFTPLQFFPAFAAIKHGTRSLDPIFAKAKELGWGRRLSVSGEEPLISNTINHGGRNILQLLLDSHFKDGFRFYGNVPKGTWERWKRRIDKDPNIDLEVIWAEKAEDYVFPWEDVWGGMPKATLYLAYQRSMSFKANRYCLSTRLIRGKCEWKQCRMCDVKGTGKPDKAIIEAIVNRKVASVIPVKQISEEAKSREKSFHVRVLFRSTDPIYRFVMKGYFMNAIARAFMKASPKFNNAFVGPLGHARIAAGANNARDWTFGMNIYDFSLNELMSESELRGVIPEVNKILKEGEVLDVRMDSHLTILRKDVDFAIYSVLIPNSGMSFGRIRSDVERFFERKYEGKESKIKVKKAQGKGVFVTVEKILSGEDIRQVIYQWMPEERGTLVRMVISAGYNPMSMLETITGRKAFSWKEFPVFCDGYVQLDEDTGDVDVFSSLFGQQQRCKVTGGVLERDLFYGQKLLTGVSLAAETGLELNYPVNFEVFRTRKLMASQTGGI